MWNVLWILPNSLSYMMPLCHAKHDFPLLILQTVKAGNTLFCRVIFFQGQSLPCKNKTKKQICLLFYFLRNLGKGRMHVYLFE